MPNVAKTWSPRGVSCVVTVRMAIDESPDLSHLERSEEDYIKEGETRKNAKKYAEQDRERLESYGDSWHMIGIWAETKVAHKGKVLKFRSGGLWGVESDSDKAYLDSVKKEEIDALLDEMRKAGVQCSEVAIEEERE